MRSSTKFSRIVQARTKRDARKSESLEYEAIQASISSQSWKTNRGVSGLDEDHSRPFVVVHVGSPARRALE